MGEEVDLGIRYSLKKMGLHGEMRRKKQPMKKWKKEGKTFGNMLKKIVAREEDESYAGVSVERSQKRVWRERNVKGPVMRTIITHMLA